MTTLTTIDPSQMNVMPDELPVRHKRDLSSFAMINMAPMCAVTFQLLIFCMATTNFTREGVIASKLPALSPGRIESIPVVPVKIDITERLAEVQHVQVDGSPQPIAGLTEHLSKLVKSGSRDAETIVNIKPDDRVRWEITLRVYNSCVAAGFTKVNWRLN